MRFLEDIKNKNYWVKVLQLGSIFFIIFVGLSLLIAHFRKITDGNFDAIYEEEFANGQWVQYFLVKAAISFVYAIYMTSRRRNFDGGKTR